METIGAISEGVILKTYSFPFHDYQRRKFSIIVRKRAWWIPVFITFLPSSWLSWLVTAVNQVCPKSKTGSFTKDNKPVYCGMQPATYPVEHSHLYDPTVLLQV